ncbi:IS3 family transposase [Streptomyces prasinus]
MRGVAKIRPNYPTGWAARKAVAATLGIGAAETVRTWARTAAVDTGRRPGVTSEETAEIKRPKAENAEPRRANKIPKAASAFFAAGLDRPSKHSWRSSTSTGRRSGVEPIRRVLTSHGLKTATSTHHAARKREPTTRPVRDTELKTQTSRVHADNFSVYGVRKAWRQLHRAGIAVARRTVARPMRDPGPQGIHRSRSIHTTVRDDGHERADDLLQHDSTAHLLKAGTGGDALDNALLKSRIGLHQTEPIKPRRPWHGPPDVALTTAERADRFDDQRLHTAIGTIPPHEHETDHYAQHQHQPAAGANA